VNYLNSKANSKWVTVLVSKYKRHSIHKLQNGAILLISKIRKIQTTFYRQIQIN